MKTIKMKIVVDWYCYKLKNNYLKYAIKQVLEVANGALFKKIEM
jgi:hypothetical protein